MAAFRVGALVLAWVLATILVLCTVLMFVPGPTGALWLLGTVATEQALVITVGAVVLAMLLRRRVMFVVIGAVVAVASLIPTVASASAAHGVEWREYLAGTSLTASEGPDVTEAFAIVDGVELRADLWFPSGDGRERPAVVWVHGGGLGDGGRRGETPEWNLLLARRGAVVVDIDYRQRRRSPPSTWHFARSSKTTSPGRARPAADAIGAVCELRARDGKALQVMGSASLAAQLIEHDLVDEYRLMIEPILLGGGKRVFPDDGQARPLELVSTTTTGTGVLICTYRPAGR